MCSRDQTELVRVKIPADLSHTGEERWKDAKIDSCIASLVRALQRAGIDMRGSCCGHGRSEGDIHLQDGRVLIILDREASDVYMSDRTKEHNVRNMIMAWEEDAIATTLGLEQ